MAGGLMLCVLATTARTAGAAGPAQGKTMFAVMNWARDNQPQHTCELADRGQRPVAPCRDPAHMSTLAVSGLVGTLAELGLVVAVGGMLWSAVRRLRRGRIAIVRCQACGRPASRAYPRCRRCGEDLP